MKNVMYMSRKDLTHNSWSRDSTIPLFDNYLLKKTIPGIGAPYGYRLFLQNHMNYLLMLTRILEMGTYAGGMCCSTIEVLKNKCRCLHILCPKNGIHHLLIMNKFHDKRVIGVSYLFELSLCDVLFSLVVYVGMGYCLVGIVEAYHDENVLGGKKIDGLMDY